MPKMTPIPRLEDHDGKWQLLVDGKPFLVLGGQAHNSSGNNADDLARVFDSLEALHANTALIPIYWELIEPEPGQFDFSTVNAILQHACKYKMRLILLWFGTWKNGESHYVPEWMKRDTRQFPRAIGPRGEVTNIVSPLSEAARNADARAFKAVMEFLREHDDCGAGILPAARHTQEQAGCLRHNRNVIMMQVENEVGFLGTDRDYSDEGNRQFNAAVPPELKAQTSGTWCEVFGPMAEEAFSAWHFARYVDYVAAAGREVYDLPMYVNAWLYTDIHDRPGTWPSGGPTVHVLDIWKAAAPHIDLLAPDIYYPKYHKVCAQYTRGDNPLFVPETAFVTYHAGFAFLTFAEFNGLGFSPFGIDDALVDGALAPEAAEFEDTYRVLAPLLPLISEYRYTGKMHSVLQGYADGEDFAYRIPIGGDVVAMVEFTLPFEIGKPRGRGMIIEVAPDDVIIVGAGFNVAFRSLEGPPRDIQILSIEEGTFHGLEWVRERRLNGDELHVSLPEKAKILRVRLMR